MKHYKKPDGSVWGFELDGSQDHLITADMVAFTPGPEAPYVPTVADEVNAILSEAGVTRMEVWGVLIGVQGLVLATASETGLATSVVEANAYATNPLYRKCKDLEARCVAKERLSA